MSFRTYHGQAVSIVYYIVPWIIFLITASLLSALGPSRETWCSWFSWSRWTEGELKSLISRKINSYSVNTQLRRFRIFCIATQKTLLTKQDVYDTSLHYAFSLLFHNWFSVTHLCIYKLQFDKSSIR